MFAHTFEMGRHHLLPKFCDRPVKGSFSVGCDSKNSVKSYGGSKFSSRKSTADVLLILMRPLLK